MPVLDGYVISIPFHPRFVFSLAIPLRTNIRIDAPIHVGIFSLNLFHAKLIASDIEKFIGKTISKDMARNEAIYKTSLYEDGHSGIINDIKANTKQVKQKKIKKNRAPQVPKNMIMENSECEVSERQQSTLDRKSVV